MRLIIATNNSGKVREFKDMLGKIGFEAVSLKDAGVDINVDEDGLTFEENARKKAREIYKAVKCPVIADDSGLVVDCLDGEPGVYSARYGGEGLSDTQRNAIILEKTQNVPREERTARFISVICFKDEGREICAQGEVEGYIGEKPLGENGFGYDPIFMLSDDISMAMLTDSDKNKISHRGRALRKLSNILEPK